MRPLALVSVFLLAGRLAAQPLGQSAILAGPEHRPRPGTPGVPGVVAGLVHTPVGPGLPGEPIPAADLSLNREAAFLSTRQAGGTEISGFTRCFRWNKGDFETGDWRPQGITGLDIGGRPFLIVSWYGRKGTAAARKGARISLVDLSPGRDPRYRHALLVRPAADGVLEPLVHCHAGGLATDGRLLYVAETRVGLRVFDLQDFRRARGCPKDRFRVSKDRIEAFNYGYVLPQVAVLELPTPPNVSYVSMDRSGPAPELLTGNFFHPNGDYDEHLTTLRWWALDGAPAFRLTGTLPLARRVRLSVDPPLVAPIRLPFQKVVGRTRVQGAARVAGPDGRRWLFLSRSYGREKGRLHVHPLPEGPLPDAEALPEFLRRGKTHPWPSYAEDLHHDPATGELWSLTEHRPTRRLLGGHTRGRYVWAVRAADYMSP